MNQIKEVKDIMGAFQVSTKIKPIDENEVDGIYLALFDNGENITNSCRFKVALNFTMNDGSKKQFVAPILNTFHPSRWLRSVNPSVREYPFYRQALEFKSQIKHQFDDLKMTKKFSCGFFYDKDIGHKEPYDTAYAYMVWIDGGQPQVGVRFFDYTIDAIEMPDNAYAIGRGPKWNKVIKDKVNVGMKSGW